MTLEVDWLHDPPRRLLGRDGQPGPRPRRWHGAVRARRAVHAGHAAGHGRRPPGDAGDAVGVGGHVRPRRARVPRPRAPSRGLRGPARHVREGVDGAYLLASRRGWPPDPTQGRSTTRPGRRPSTTTPRPAAGARLALVRADDRHALPLRERRDRRCRLGAGHRWWSGRWGTDRRYVPRGHRVRRAVRRDRRGHGARWRARRDVGGADRRHDACGLLPRRCPGGRRGDRSRGPGCPRGRRRCAPRLAPHRRRHPGRHRPGRGGHLGHRQPPGRRRMPTMPATPTPRPSRRSARTTSPDWGEVTDIAAEPFGATACGWRARRGGEGRPSTRHAGRPGARPCR